MWLSQTTRNNARIILAVAALGILGACSDQQSVAPIAVKARAFKVPANFTEVGEPVVFQVSQQRGRHHQARRRPPHQHSGRRGLRVGV
jgi:hypothetical protein